MLAKISTLATTWGTSLELQTLSIAAWYRQVYEHRLAEAGCQGSVVSKAISLNEPCITSNFHHPHLLMTLKGPQHIHSASLRTVTCVQDQALKALSKHKLRNTSEDIHAHLYGSGRQGHSVSAQGDQQTSRDTGRANGPEERH